MTAHGVTHPGHVRERNEDAFFVDADLGLFIVADGMGGHNAGEVASQMAVDVVRMFLVRSRDGEDVTWPFGFNPTLSIHVNRVVTAIQMANRRVFKASESNDAYAGMGTTIVVLMITGDDAVYAGVGDSRLYGFLDGRLSQLTRDDSWLAAVLESDPIVDRATLATHPLRHVLTSVVGAREQLEVRAVQRRIEPGERFLICTDGLHGAIDEAAISSVLASGDDVAAAALRLVDAALQSSGTDNITAVLLSTRDEKHA